MRQPACRPDPLAALAAAIAGPAPPIALDDLPVPAIKTAVLDLLLDRIDAALYERRIVIDCDVLAAFLMALFPPEFEVPDEPDAPTCTPPGSAGVDWRARSRSAALQSARVRVYVRRCRDAVHLYHPDDATGDQPGRGLRVAQRGNLAPRVLGWAGPGRHDRPAVG